MFTAVLKAANAENATSRRSRSPSRRCPVRFTYKRCKGEFGFVTIPPKIAGTAKLDPIQDANIVISNIVRKRVANGLMLKAIWVENCAKLIQLLMGKGCCRVLWYDIYAHKFRY